MIFLLIILHLILFGGAIAVLKIADEDDVIDDFDDVAAFALFVPAIVLIWVGGLYLAEYIINKRG